MFAGNSAVSGKRIYLSRSAALSKPPDYRMFASAAAYDGNIEFILCYLHFYSKFRSLFRPFRMFRTCIGKSFSSMSA